MILTGKVRSGFSLTELMLALLLTVIIGTGLMVTFKSIRAATSDSIRANGITTSLKSLSNQLRYDFSNAGRGFTDLSLYNIQYQFMNDFINEPNAGKNFYGITDHTREADGNSAITLQWFDYEINRGPTSITPTFLFSFANPGVTNPLDAGNLHSNSVNALTDVQEGDIFLVYSIAPMLTSNTSQYLRDEATKPAPWNNPALNPNTTVGNNAVLVQANAVGAITPPADSSLQNARAVTFGAVAGTVFNNNFPGGGLTRGMDPSATLTNAAALTLANLSVDGSGAITQPQFLARKLGNSNNFHRVTYYVETAPSGRKTLMRQHNNDDPEVIAVNIDNFQISLGFDVDPSIAPADVLLADQNGSVNANVNEPDSFWIEDGTAYPGSLEDYHIFVGRHAIAAKVSFTQSSLTDSWTGGPSQPVQRSFEQQFRVNSFLPMPYM